MELVYIHIPLIYTIISSTVIQSEKLISHYPNYLKLYSSFKLGFEVTKHSKRGILGVVNFRNVVTSEQLALLYSKLGLSLRKPLLPPTRTNFDGAYVLCMVT